MQNDIIVKVGLKNKKALEHLYNHYEWTVYLLVYRIAGHQGLAEEIMSKLFRRIWESKGTALNSDQKLSVQMLQMTKEIAYNHLHTQNSLASAAIEEDLT